MAVGESSTGGIAAAGSRAGSPRSGRGGRPRARPPERTAATASLGSLGAARRRRARDPVPRLGPARLPPRSRAGERRERPSSAARRTSSAKPDGSLLTTPSTTLVIGTDGGSAGRKGARRSDSLMLLHTDPDTHPGSRTSIPRDSRRDPPLRLREDQRGEPVRRAALTLATVRKPHRPPHPPRGRRRLRRLQGPDRRARRHRHHSP